MRSHNRSGARAPHFEASRFELARAERNRHGPRQVFAFVALLTLFGAADATRASISPVTRVVELLKDDAHSVSSTTLPLFVLRSSIFLTSTHG